jgi:hypothetical protein
MFEHVGFLRHDDVLAHQQAADLLLLYVAPGVGSQGVYTGKVFEYVAARRPVLALVPRDNVAALLLDRAGATRTGGGARVDPEDVEGIARAVLDAWRTWRSATRVADIATPDDVMRSIERRAGAARLAELLTRLQR